VGALLGHVGELMTDEVAPGSGAGRERADGEGDPAPSGDGQRALAVGTVMGLGAGVEVDVGERHPEQGLDPITSCPRERAPMRRDRSQEAPDPGAHAVRLALGRVRGCGRRPVFRQRRWAFGDEHRAGNRRLELPRGGGLDPDPGRGRGGHDWIPW
jgi:hypothetical protein